MTWLANSSVIMKEDWRLGFLYRREWPALEPWLSTTRSVFQTNDIVNVNSAEWPSVRAVSNISVRSTVETVVFDQPQSNHLFTFGAGTGKTLCVDCPIYPRLLALTAANSRISREIYFDLPEALDNEILYESPLKDANSVKMILDNRFESMASGTYYVKVYTDAVVELYTAVAQLEAVTRSFVYEDDDFVENVGLAKKRLFHSATKNARFVLKVVGRRVSISCAFEIAHYRVLDCGDCSSIEYQRNEGILHCLAVTRNRCGTYARRKCSRTDDDDDCGPVTHNSGGIYPVGLSENHGLCLPNHAIQDRPYEFSRIYRLHAFPRMGIYETNWYSESRAFTTGNFLEEKRAA